MIRTRSILSSCGSKPLQYKGDPQMIGSIKKLFIRNNDNITDTGPRQDDHDIQLATCALFLEMARIDETFTRQEEKMVLDVLKKKFGLSGEHADAMLEAADKELENSLDYWQFAKLINETYSVEEKIKVIETLWQIVFVDGKMNEHEHYFMNKMKNLLRLSQRQLIDAKLKILHAT